MPLFVCKCNLCGHKEEIMIPVTNELPIGCKNPEFRCSGIMEKMVRENMPYVHPDATPTRRNNSGINYRYKHKDM